MTVQVAVLEPELLLLLVVLVMLVVVVDYTSPHINVAVVHTVVMAEVLAHAGRGRCVPLSYSCAPSLAPRTPPHPRRHFHHPSPLCHPHISPAHVIGGEAGRHVLGTQIP